MLHLKIYKSTATTDYLNKYCNALNKQNIYCGCKKNHKYGDFCGKHKKSYLLNSNGIISLSKFTNKLIDYNHNDIHKTISYIHNVDQYYNIPLVHKFFNTPSTKPVFKKEVLDILNNLITYINKHKQTKENTIQYYNNHIINIIKLQKYIRRFLIINDNKYKGPAYLNIHKSCNDEDVYTLCLLNEIDNNFFFSYEDNNKRIWSFDIRSLKKIIDMKQGNPYNREKIPLRVILNIGKRIRQLQEKNLSIEIDKPIEEDIKTYNNHRCIDVFQHLNQFGYGVNESLFINLSITQLKLLYEYLEDIWNYRAQISHAIKTNICPPNGVVFNISKQIINNHTDKDELQKILLDDIYKLVCSGLDGSDQKLGSMYFLIGLGKINPVIYQYVPWIQYA
jgi:hypothetical protein